MLRCFGGGLYLLDEATTNLKLRAQFGLEETAFLMPARRLETAIADIEALAGHAVVIDDTELLSHWSVPVPCGAAICVPVSSPTTILGTLWLFAEDKSLTPPADFKLGTLCQYFRVDLSEDAAHDAMNDVRATVQLYQAMRRHENQRVARAA